MAVNLPLDVAMELDCIRPDWPAPANVRALATTRHGGHSRAAYAGLNLGDHVGDDPLAVAHNRADLQADLQLPGAPRWLSQVHGSDVVHADSLSAPVQADATWSATPGVVCTVLTADCLPVLFCSRDGRQVAVAHAGWRGLCAGVLAQTADSFLRAGIAPADILVWLGPAIGPAAYEVDATVRDAFLRNDPSLDVCFVSTRAGHWSFNLCMAARALLAAQGITDVSGGDLCTYADERFFSYRREPQCGRQATLVWLQESASL
jgi:YfiH family protein